MNAFKIAMLERFADNAPAVIEVTWPELVELLTSFPDELPCSVETCTGKNCPHKQARESWSPVAYAVGAKRANENVEAITAFVADLDHLKPGDLDRIRVEAESYAYVVHTTHSHAAGDEAYRLVMPLDRAVAPREWPSVRAGIVAALRLPIDPTTGDLARIFALPDGRTGIAPFAISGEGKSLEVDEALACAREAAASRPVSAPTAFEPSPPEVYALDDLRSRLAELRRSKAHRDDENERERADLIGRILDQRPIATSGSRDATLHRACSILAYALPVDVPWGAVLEIVRPSLYAMTTEPEGVDHWVSEARDMFERARDRRREAKATEAAALARIVESVTARRPVPSNDDVRVEEAIERPKIVRLTDAGNAELFARLNGDKVRYLKKMKTWLVWDGKRWTPDETGEVFRLAKATARDVLRQANEEAVDDQRKRLIAHATKSESAHSIGAMVELARWETGISVTPDQLDADAFSLNVANGTLDLRTAQLRPHRREDLITKVAPVEFDPAAVSPTWNVFLERVLPSPELRSFVQRFCGYALSADAREHVFAIFFGSGANGKSTLLETLRAVLGDYMKNVDASALLVKNGDGPRNDIAALVGARFVTASETESGKRLAEGLVKSLTGGDAMTARFLYGEFFTFKPTFKLVVSTNFKPVIRGADHGIWTRIRLVPFAVTIPESERDPKLLHRLAGELPGVLRWAVDGFAAWQREGLGVPAEVVEATDEYKSEMDPLAEFLVDKCSLDDPNAQTPTAVLFDAYRTWAMGRRDALEKQQFADALSCVTGLTTARIGKARTRGWRGVSLRGYASAKAA